jgi:uncharacterized protein
MVIDALVLLGENRFGPSLLAGDALNVAMAEGVDHLLAAPARPPDYHLEPANDAVAATCRASGGRVSLLGRIDPLNGARAVQEARRCIDELGAVGLFLHPSEECFPVASSADVLAVAADCGVPVIVATGYYGVSEPLQVAELAATFPDVPVIMTTGGQINISGLSMADAWTALLEVGNLHVMTNGEYRQDFVERLSAELGTRVLYGSFAPTFDQRFEMRRVRSARMDAVARTALEQGNAVRLFGLAQPSGGSR